MKCVNLSAAGLLCLLADVSHAPGQTNNSTATPYFEVIDLGDLAGRGSTATAINGKGQVTGYSWVGSFIHAGFIYSNGVMMSIGTFSNADTYAECINNSGQVAGYNSLGHAFVCVKGMMTDIGSFGGTYTRAYGVNDGGTVVGYSDKSNGVSRAFLYSNGAMQDLGTLGGDSSGAWAVNNAGQTVGGADLSNNISTHACLFANGKTVDLDTNQNDYSWAYAVSANGLVTGIIDTPPTSILDHAFLYANGSMQDLGTLNGAITDPYGINSSGRIVGSAWFISSNAYRAFLYSNGSIKDLNSLIGSNANWILEDAYGINDTGQIVGDGVVDPNGAGEFHAFLLNPLVPGAIEAPSRVQTALPVYNTSPVSSQNKNLVVITHGWIPPWSTAENSTAWVNLASNAIVQYLNNYVQTPWAVYGCFWEVGANIPLYLGGPITALHNAHQQGKMLGDSIVLGGWTNIHFIAHSAGAGLIQSATEEIKATSPVPTRIHSTFLDAYDGLFLQYTAEYGFKADWADSYFSRDLETGQATQQPLFHAYNVDVTTLDPQAIPERLAGYVSTGTINDPCFKTESSHEWPTTFYVNTISGNITSDYSGFGFPLSDEAGNWNFATAQYPPGNGTFMDSRQTQVLGPADPTCSLYLDPSQYLGSGTGFPNTSTVKSPTGTVQTFQNAVAELTGSGSAPNPSGNRSPNPSGSLNGTPAWVATVITQTNALNCLAFEAEFDSALGSDGLLSVYWDTNMIGLIDEAAVPPGLQKYTLSFPSAAANTSHVLGFHLDPFTAIQSSINITNIALGFVGVTQPFSLLITTNLGDGFLVYRLIGQPANYTIQASTSLSSSTWTNIAILANTTGSVDFIDVASTNYPCRFYRATSE